MRGERLLALERRHHHMSACSPGPACLFGAGACPPHESALRLRCGLHSLRLSAAC